MLKSMFAAALLASAAIGTTASAATLTYKATSAQSDSVASDFHSLWAAPGLGHGLGQNLHFIPAGAFVVEDDESGDPGGITASLTGTVSTLDQSSGFELSFQYDNDLTAYGASGPTFKSEQGSSENSSTYFLTLIGGTLTGFGELLGANFAVEVMPEPGDARYAVQIGFDANNKNENYGLANWFFFRATQDCDNDSCDRLNNRQGDINIDLAPVPLPASSLLMLLGIGSIVGARRLKK